MIGKLNNWQKACPPPRESGSPANQKALAGFMKHVLATDGRLVSTSCRGEWDLVCLSIRRMEYARPNDGGEKEILQIKCHHLLMVPIYHHIATVCPQKK